MARRDSGDGGRGNNSDDDSEDDNDNDDHDDDRDDNDSLAAAPAWRIVIGTGSQLEQQSSVKPAPTPYSERPG